MVGRVALVVLSAALGVGIGFAGHQYGPPLPERFRLGAAPTDTVAAAPTSSAPAPDASASAGAPSASASAAAAPPVDVDACTKAMFPPATFMKPGSGVTFVCEEANVVKGASRMKEAVVGGATGTTTEAMKEWAVLGFYELPVYAVVRDACCPTAPPLEVADAPESCPSMKAAIEEVVAASRPGSPDDAPEAALKDYTKATKCIVKNKIDKAFGAYDPPASGQQGAAKKTVDRRRTAK